MRHADRLAGQRAPIRGEAGVGYILEDGFEMPPQMLTPDEVEAATPAAPSRKAIILRASSR